MPELEHRTPREAVRTGEGRAKVVALLKLLESSEQRRIRRDRKGPADLVFLWQEVSLDREEFLAAIPDR